MASTSTDAEIDGLKQSARPSALRRWLRAEDHAAAVDETVDMRLAVKVTGEAVPCARRDRGRCEIKSLFVGCTPALVCHSLVRVSVMLDEVLSTVAGRDDGRPNGKQLI